MEGGDDKREWQCVMVKVRENYAVTGDGEVDLEKWVAHIASQTHLEDLDQFRRACEKAAEIDRQASREDRLWAPGTSSFEIGLEMAQVLAELGIEPAAARRIHAALRVVPLRALCFQQEEAPPQNMHGARQIGDREVLAQRRLLTIA